VLTSPGTVLLTIFAGVLVVLGRTETLTSRVPPPDVGPQTSAIERPHFTSLRPVGWLVDAVCWCGHPADQGADSQQVVPVRAGLGVDTPSALRHSAWPAAGGPERHGLMGTALEIRPRSQLAASYLARDLARGKGVVSAHVGTTPLQPDGWDVRWGLMEMAAAQRRDWTRRCPCRIEPMARLGRGSV